jgi:glycosyltransferase involved in cell wall biosynthesis
MAELPQLLSAVLIVKNESKTIESCLKSISPAVDEIIVADTGSTDDTIQKASACGARVINIQWNNNFAEARNHTIREAKGKFIIWFDADDILPHESIEPLRTLLDTDPSAWTMIIENMYENRPGQNFRQIRLFPNGKDIFFNGRIHETLGPSIAEAGISTRHSTVRIIHTGYNTETARTQKTNRNHELLKLEIIDHPDEPAVLMEMGNSHHQRGEYSQAISYYEKISSIPFADSNQRDIFRSVPSLVGVSRLAMADIGGAEAAFRSSIELFPERASAYYHLAEIAIKKNDVETLIDMSNQLIRLPEEVNTVACDFKGMVAHAYGWAGNISLIRGDAASAAKLFAESESRRLPPAFTYEIAIEAAKKANLPKLQQLFEIRRSKELKGKK